MPSANDVILAAAGSGKTTRIVMEALAKPCSRIAVVTYTINNLEEIRAKFFELRGSIPANVDISSWFTFLLRHGARPYQNYVYADHRIGSIAFVTGRSSIYVPKEDAQKYYFYEGKNIYTDKISEFSCVCNAKSKGLVINRLSKIFDEIFLDEIQDLAGYDLDFLELLLKSPIRVLMVGDSRQWTYSTNNSQKNRQYKGTQITNLFKKWETKDLCKIDNMTESHRCNQAICDFADGLYPHMPKTTSLNCEETCHDGVFLVSPEDVNEYVSEYKPWILRYNKKTDCAPYSASNFGESKGLTFDRVLIFPNGPIEKYLKTGKLAFEEGTCSKFYVAVTRARYSVAIVYSGVCKLGSVSRYQRANPEELLQPRLL